MSSANRESYFFFSVWIPFISFSSLIAVTKTSKTMLNSNGESGHQHPCLIPGFRGKVFRFSVLRKCLLWVCNIYGFYHVATPVFILAWRVQWTEETGGLQSMGV